MTPSNIGAALLLPTEDTIGDVAGSNFERMLSGEIFIETLSDDQRGELVSKNITLKPRIAETLTVHQPRSIRPPVSCISKGTELSLDKNTGAFETCMKNNV